ncbi:MAG: hypothetical protein KDA92_16045, partial [Planctomycetales bacterium]|nr:hypothetical protein [Planctomycetales bacterium]
PMRSRYACRFNAGTFNVGLHAKVADNLTFRRNIHHTPTLPFFWFGVRHFGVRPRSYRFSRRLAANPQPDSGHAMR